VKRDRRPQERIHWRMRSGAERFDAARPRLQRIAQRILGSAAEVDDALQESWLRISRADVAGVANLEGWLTTVVARACLDALKWPQAGARS